MSSPSWPARTEPGSMARRCVPTTGSSDPAPGVPPSTPTQTADQRTHSMSKQVILVTGASSGFGLMTAQLLAQAGHTVYASMRETQGRNAPQVRTVAEWAAGHKVDLRTVELDVQFDASAEAGIARII